MSSSNGRRSKGWKIWMKARSVDAMPKSIDHSPPGGGAKPGTAAAGTQVGTQVGTAAGGDPNPPARGYALLAADEPPPVFEIGLQGQSNFVIVVDHASRRI